MKMQAFGWSDGQSISFEAFFLRWLKVSLHSFHDVPSSALESCLRR